MVFGTKTKFVKLPVTELLIRTNANTTLTPVTSFKYLGLWFDSHLTFGMHIDTLTTKTYAKLGVLYRNKSSLSLLVRKRIAQQMLMPIIDCGDIVYGSAPQTHLSKLDTLYNSICRFVLQCNYNTHHCEMLKELDWSTLESRRKVHLSCLAFKFFMGKLPSYLNKLLTPTTCSTYHLRSDSKSLFMVPRLNKVSGRSSFSFRAPQNWNNLPETLTSTTSLSSFKSKAVSHFNLVCNCFIRS
ncbi:hypothetical protein FKM82_009775 [Ascaphus truei]